VTYTARHDYKTVLKDQLQAMWRGLAEGEEGRS